MGETEPGADQLDQQIWGDEDEHAGDEGTFYAFISNLLFFPIVLYNKEVHCSVKQTRIFGISTFLF